MNKKCTNILIAQTLMLCISLAVAQPDRKDNASGNPMTVTISLPWYIKFSIMEKPYTFQPILLKGKLIKSANASTTKDIEFFTFDDSDNQHKSFLNKSPYSFSVGDVIDLELIYGVKPDTNRASHSLIRHIPFKYTIGMKTSDVINLQIDEPKKPIQIDARSEVDSANVTCANCTELEIALGFQSELLKTALDYGTFGTKLLLTGNVSPSNNAVDVMTKFLDEQLNLAHLMHNITQAKFIDEGLLFEMSTSMDVVEILTQTRLKQSNLFDIKTSKRDFIEPLLLQRIDSPKKN